MKKKKKSTKVAKKNRALSYGALAPGAGTPGTKK